MKKMIDFLWNPSKKTLQGFNYGTYLILAPGLLLGLILPANFILGLLFSYFIIKTIVTLRAAITHEIEDEKLHRYSENHSVAKKAYILFSAMMLIFVIGAIVFYIKTGGLLGVVLSLFIITLSLPGFIEEIIIIRRCQAERQA